LWHYWTFSAPHAVIRRPRGDSAPGYGALLITPLHHAFMNCKVTSTPLPYLHHQVGRVSPTHLSIMTKLWYCDMP